MIKRISLILAFCAMVVVSCKTDEDNKPVEDTYSIYTLETTLGNISVYLYENTPLHQYNFDSLSRAGFYDGLIFHRVIDGFVIQGGDPDGTGSGGPGYTIPAEIKGEYPHIYGALAAARLSDNVNPEKRSSGSQFYIVEDKNGEPGLNGNYTVFGETVAGFNVVDSIASVPKNGSKPVTDVVINKISIEEKTPKEILDEYGLTVPK